MKNAKHIAEIIATCLLCFFIGTQVQVYKDKQTAIAYGIAGYNRVTGKFEMYPMNEAGFPVPKIDVNPEVVEKNPLPIRKPKVMK